MVHRGRVLNRAIYRGARHRWVVCELGLRNGSQVAGGLGARILLASCLLAFAAVISGPHLEAMVYRSFDLSELTADLHLYELGH